MTVDVLLINPPLWVPGTNRDRIQSSPPLGLGYMASSLISQGVTVKILDLAISFSPYEQLASMLYTEKPQMVGITSLTQNYVQALNIAKLVRAINPDTFIVFGGPHVTYEWKKVLKSPCMDAVVLFEGEQAIVDLYRCLDAGKKDFEQVPGIAFRKGDQSILTNPRPLEKHLDRLPFPARHLLPMANYQRPGTIMSSRGCPQKCIFCISSTFEGSYRSRSAENVVDELEVLHDTWGVREMHFLDNVFTVDKRRVQDICSQIIQRGLNIRFNCVSRADLATKETIAWLKAAGCERIEIGVETATQEMIDALQKNITLDQVMQAADIVLGAGLVPMFTFQIGSPFETPESLKKSHDLAAHLRSKGATTFFSIMTPFPGTPLRLKAKELGITIHEADWSEYRTSNPLYDTRVMDRGAFRKALYQEIALLGSQ